MLIFLYKSPEFLQSINSMKKNQEKIKWTEEEDFQLSELRKEYNCNVWAKIASDLHQKFDFPHRSSKQCRQRWNNHLNPNLEKKDWSSQEEQMLLEQHRIHGNKWTKIKEIFKGREENSIKNHFFSMMRRCFTRINSCVGFKNSSKKIKHLKSTTLSSIFSMASNNNFSLVENKFYEEQLRCLPPQLIYETILKFIKIKQKPKTESQDKKIYLTILSLLWKIQKNCVKKEIQKKTDQIDNGCARKRNTSKKIQCSMVNSQQKDERQEEIQNEERQISIDLFNFGNLQCLPNQSLSIFNPNESQMTKNSKEENNEERYILFQQN